MIEVNNKMIEDIKEVIVNSRQKVVYEVNNAMLLAYWNVGKIIVQNEQNGNIKAEYGKQVLKELSSELRKSLGAGFQFQIFNICEIFILNIQNIRHCLLN